jgi:hypothetical protein
MELNQLVTVLNQGAPKYKSYGAERIGITRASQEPNPLELYNPTALRLT